MSACSKASPKNIFVSSPSGDQKNAFSKFFLLLNFDPKTQFFEALPDVKKDGLFCIKIAVI